MPVVSAPPAEPVTQQVAVAPAPLPTGPTETTPGMSDKSLASPSVLPKPSEDSTSESSDNNDISALPTPKPSIPPKMPSSGPHTPIGVIVATVIGMIVLSSLAIAVYMASQSSL
jgi:hypothetical protein